jgi:uncharacterized protein (DUF427 family)
MNTNAACGSAGAARLEGSDMTPPVTPTDEHVRATWKGEVIADSDKTILVEGNYYFPPDSVKRDLLSDSSQHSHCPWKGDASYYDVTVSGESNARSAWYYPEPYEAAVDIKDYVAFWNGVEVAPAG